MSIVDYVIERKMEKWRAAAESFSAFNPSFENLISRYAHFSTCLKSSKIHRPDLNIFFLKGVLFFMRWRFEGRWNGQEQTLELFNFQSFNWISFKDKTHAGELRLRRRFSPYWNGARRTMKPKTWSPLLAVNLLSDGQYGVNTE